MEGVAYREAKATHHALVHAERWLLLDGSTTLGIEFNPHAKGGGGVELVLLAAGTPPTAGARLIIAAQHDFVRRRGDGQFLYVTKVTLDASNEPIYTACSLDSAMDTDGCTTGPWYLPVPPPAGYTAAVSPLQLQLSGDEIELAMEFATFNSVKFLLVLPLTLGRDLSFAQCLGAAPSGCTSLASHKAKHETPKEVASRLATHFFSWSFAQQFGRYVAAFGAFLADHNVDEATCYTWISPISEDQHAISDFTKETWAAIFKQRLHDIGHLVLLFSPWGNAAPLGRIWCLWELFIASQSDDITITVQLPPQDEASLTRAVLHSEVSASWLVKGISTINAEARDPAADAMIRESILAAGGYDVVDAAIRAELERALTIPAHRSAISEASRSQLRSIVLTEGQGELVRRIFYNIERDEWRRGRWRLDVPASSGKSYIAVHLVGQWAMTSDGGAALYLCHHARMQQYVVKQIQLELRKELGHDAELVLEEAGTGEGSATWIRTPVGAEKEAEVLVATIDGAIDLAVIDVLASAVDGKRDVAARIASFLKGAVPDLYRENMVNVRGVEIYRARNRALEGKNTLAGRFAGIVEVHRNIICKTAGIVKYAHSDPWSDYARLCFTCATSRCWHGRFGRGGVSADEGHLVCGREARAEVAGQHRVRAAAMGTVLGRWADDQEEGSGRLVVLSDDSQINENPHDINAKGKTAIAHARGHEDVHEQMRAIEWEIDVPVYPENCVSSAVDDDVAALLRMNLRNSHTVRDASVLYYKPRATMAIEIQPLHTNSALGRELETIDINQSGGRPSHRTDPPYALAEEYAWGIATAMLKVYGELSSDVDASFTLDRKMIAVLTPYYNEEWDGRFAIKNKGGRSLLGTGIIRDPRARATWRARVRAATVSMLRAAADGVEWNYSSEFIEQWKTDRAALLKVKNASKNAARGIHKLLGVGWMSELPNAPAEFFYAGLSAPQDARQVTGDFDDWRAAAGIVADAITDGAPWLVWECVENFVGLDVPIVIMAGFDPLGMRHAEEQDKSDIFDISDRKRLTMEQIAKKTNRRDRDPLAYMAMTRATYGAIVVEPNVERFTRHYRIRTELSDVGANASAGAMRYKWEGGGAQSYFDPNRWLNGWWVGKDVGLAEVRHVVHSDGRQLLCPVVIDLSDRALTEVPSELLDPCRVSTTQELRLGANEIQVLPQSIGTMLRLKKLDLSTNNLTLLPNSIVALKELMMLDLRANPLIRPQSFVIEAWFVALTKAGCNLFGVQVDPLFRVACYPEVWEQTGMPLLMKTPPAPAQGPCYQEVWEQTKMSLLVACCSKSHCLKLFETLHGGYNCDVCGNMQRKGAKMYGCRPCNFDKCQACMPSPPPKASSQRSREESGRGGLLGSLLSLGIGALDKALESSEEDDGVDGGEEGDQETSSGAAARASARPAEEECGSSAGSLGGALVGLGLGMLKAAVEDNGEGGDKKDGCSQQ